MTRSAVAALVLALLAGGVPAQQQPRAADGAARGLPGDVVLGPRLLDYPVECVDQRGCRIECFQNGVKIVARGNIGIQDDVRLIASTGNAEDVVPRWIEVRPFNGSDVETLLLSPATFCDLKSLVISPKPRP